MKIALLSLKIVHLRSRGGTVTDVSAQGGELLFIMALLGQAVQTLQTGQVPPQGGDRHPIGFGQTFSTDEQRHTFFTDEQESCYTQI